MRAYILVLTLILTGCASDGGFSTGGLPPRMPPQLYNLYIETNEPDSALHRALRQELMAQGVRVADMRPETNTILRISREGVERRAGPAGSGRDAPREYQLIYTATYVVTVDGRELFFPETLNTYRNYTASGGGGSAAGMGQSFEESSILDTLARDMSRQIMRKLTSLPQ
jgi:outer membrane lipopolysaccharide assembly protein LptE/RlpB